MGRRVLGRHAAFLFLARAKLINLFFPFPGLGVKCVNILYEGRVRGVEAPALFKGYFLPISF